MASSRSFKPTPEFRKKEEQLRQSIAAEAREKLRSDLAKLFKDTQFSDLLLSVNSKQLPVHGFILKARCTELYAYCQDHAEDNRVSVEDLSFEDLERLLRSMYSEDHVDYSNTEEALCLQLSKCSTSETSLSADLIQLVGDSSGDVEFVVEGKTVKAHRAILAARCDYFAAMFSSSWKETLSSTVTIPDISYEAFGFAMKFLYGACQDLVTAKIVQILQLADMYGIPGIQNLVISHLKITKCHLFHKPCAHCVPQVYECLYKFCESYPLECLKLQCVQWIGRHFKKTLACKEFTLLSETFQNDVRVEIEKQVDESTTVDVWSKCTALIRYLGNYQSTWARSVQDFVEKIRATCLTVIIEHFVGICNSLILRPFLKHNNYSSWPMEDLMNALLEELTVNNCCHILRGLLNIVEMSHHPGYKAPFDSETFAVVERSCQRCEKFAIARIGLVARTEAWETIGAAKQKELKDAAFFVEL